AVIERDTRRHLPRISDIELPVAPALLGLMRRRKLAEAPRHVLEQEIREDVSRVATPAVQPRGTPEVHVLVGTITESVFVLLVVAPQRACLEQMLAEHARVVVFDD